MRKCSYYLLACLLFFASSLAMAQADDEWKSVLSAILADSDSIDSNVGNILNALSSVTANQDRDFSVSQAIAQELHTIATNQNNSTSSEIGSIISQDGIMVEGWDDLMTALEKLLTEETFVYEMSKQNTLLDELITPLAKEETLERFRVGMDEHMFTVNANLQDISANLVGVQEGLQTISEQLPYDDSESWEENEPPTGSEYEPPTSTPENEYEAEVSNDFEAGTLEQMDQTAFTTFFQSNLVPWLDSGGNISDLTEKLKNKTVKDPNLPK